MTRAIVALAAAAALGACASAGPEAAAPAPAGDARGYLRRVAPFPVADATGDAYGLPFLGGLDVPRPQLFDVDADGDLDLFVQERSGELMFLENAGTAERASLEWRTDRFQGLDIGEWSRFVDVDRDGDLDLLAEQPFSYIRLFRNTGSAEAPRYEAAADTIRDEQGRPVFADRQNIPSIVDFDCDGLYDLFLGRVDGTITRYEETERTGPGGVPRFRFVTDRFQGIEIIGQLLGSLHGANAMAFYDFDADGDLDLFWGDFFEPGLLLIRNQGSCAEPSLRGEPVPFPADDPVRTSGYNVPLWADLDGDADADLLVGVLGGAFNPNRTAAGNLHYYERTGARTIARRTDRFLDAVDVGSESVPALADLDGDGDADLLVGNKLDPEALTAARLYLFRNTGTPEAPAFRLADTLALADAYHQAPAAGDLDGDGDPDLLLGTWNEGVLFFRNESGAFVRDSAVVVPELRGSNFTPALADLDADGDLDLLVGEASGEVNFLRNTGTPRAPRFEIVTDALAGIDAGRRSHPAPTDLDGDGDLDLVVGREAGGIAYFRNDGGAAGPRFVADPGFALPLHGASAPVFHDLDGDGVPELVAGTLGGGLLYFERR